jgi:Mg-chelatase subunit ChlD
MEAPAVGGPLVALGRELRPRGGTPFGPALQAAATWLNYQPYEEKRLWVFSDGRWSAADRADLAWRAHLQHNVVVWVLDEEVPESPAVAMPIIAAPALADLVELAPATYWAGARPTAGRLPA